MQNLTGFKAVFKKVNETPEKIQSKWNSAVNTSRSRIPVDKSSPGPGSYSPLENDSAPQVSFPKALRVSIVPKEKSPGPGEYQVNEYYTKGPKYTIASRNSINRRSPTPGPGSYDPMHETLLERFPSVRIGRSKRSFNLESKCNPGPASYSMDLSTLSGPKWTFATSSKQALQKSKNACPGPGAYKISSSGSGIAYTISLSKKLINRNITPGPGSYSIDKKRDNSPSALIGSTEREIKTNSNTPGPGAYNTEIEKSKPSAIFGTSKRQDNKRLISPGPGNYNMPDVLGRGPRYSIRSKLPILKKFITPVLNIQGPGSYEIENLRLLETDPKYTIPSTGRDSPPTGF